MCYSRRKCPVKELKDAILLQEKYDIEMATSTIHKYNPKKNFINQLKNVIYTEWLLFHIKMHSKKNCPWCAPPKRSLFSNYSRNSV